MLKFVKINQESPSKTSVEKRVKSFDEISAQFASNTAEEQASRCSQCGVPFCQVHVLYNKYPTVEVNCRRKNAGSI